MDASFRASPERAHFAAIFIAAAGTLILQILAVRILGATVFASGAFVIISVALLGLTAGALFVMLGRDRIGARLDLWLGIFFALSGVFIWKLNLLAHGDFFGWFGMFAPPRLAWVCVFLFALAGSFSALGAAIAALLTLFANGVGRLYAADLCGAAAGCAAVSAALPALGAPGTLAALAVGFAALSLFFAMRNSSSPPRRPVRKRTKKRRGDGGAFVRRMRIALLGGAVFSGACLLVFAFRPDSGLLSDGRWNSYSFVNVRDNFRFEWGVPAARIAPLEAKGVFIDAGAATTLHRFSGDWDAFDFLRADVVNAAYYARPIRRAAVIGVGGGRDVLSALRFGATDILALEYNSSIADLLRREYADFNGGLFTSYPEVRLINDEARSYLRRENPAADLIMVSLVDTWAATAAGALATAETPLYTREGWRALWDALNERGILSFTRWHNEVEPPRLAALARETLRAAGVKNPPRHIAALATSAAGYGTHERVITMLVSKAPFASAEIKRLRAAALENGWIVMLAPGGENGDAATPRSRTAGDFLARILREDAAAFSGTERRLALAPTDDSPFFFQNWDWLDFDFVAGLASDLFVRFEAKGPGLMLFALVFVSLLSAALIFAPLLLFRRRQAMPPFSRCAPPLAFFCCIGLGYITLEIALLQRFTIFLGHPGYALPAALAAMLAASGAGSYFSAAAITRFGAFSVCAAAISAPAIAGLLLPPALLAFAASENIPRLALCVSFMAAIGAPLGMLFPAGIRAAAAAGLGEMTPWFWGINGAMSVLAAVLEVFIAQIWGIGAAIWFAFVLYAAACALLLHIRKSPRIHAPETTAPMSRR
jgi:spermidine synthase